MGQLELMNVSLNSPGKSWHIGRHSHDCHEVIVILWAKEKVRTDSGTFEASEGEVLLFRPGIWHEEWSDGIPALETIFFCFHTKSLPKSLPMKISDTKGRLKTIAGWMLNEGRSASSPESRRLLDSYLDAFIAEMERITKHHDSPLVENIRNRILKEPADDYSLDELAKSAGLSKYHFLRKYTRLSGTSPSDDVRRIRMSIARDLLLTSDFPLKIIAEKTGLGNEASLCRSFRKYLRKSPGEFRKL